ncbi:hypothetical protein C4588_06495 [Candidatus Parcubacteria bacterium]|nr:MAG: hypothetical protein C4588_06495 [Candidatus Parcubacteria bacterium]
MSDKRISPLEILVAAHADTPVKVVPKNRLGEVEVLDSFNTELETILNSGEQKPVFVSNNWTINLNMNIDGEMFDKALQKSAEVAKQIAAIGAAMLGTAVVFGKPKKINKVKIPLAPKTKLPKL